MVRLHVTLTNPRTGCRELGIHAEEMMTQATGLTELNLGCWAWKEAHSPGRPGWCQ